MIEPLRTWSGEAIYPRDDGVLYGDDVDALLGDVNPCTDTRFMSDREFGKFIDSLFESFQKPVSDLSDTSNREDESW